MSAFNGAGSGGSLPYRVIRRDKKLYKKEGSVQKSMSANYSLFLNNLQALNFCGTGPREPFRNGGDLAAEILQQRALRMSCGNVWIYLNAWRNDVIRLLKSRSLFLISSTFLIE